MSDTEQTRPRDVALLATVLTLVLWPVASRAGDGVVALQTADPSCSSPNRGIYLDCGNGTVTDGRSGLVWLKDANCLNSAVDWFAAMEFVAGLSDKPATSAAASQDCGLSDGSSPGEWRLPSVEEWEAMIADALGQGGDPDCTASPPTITNDSGVGCWVGGPSSFSDVVSSDYWSSTTSFGGSVGAWAVSLGFGLVDPGGKASDGRVWPVRGGQ